MSMLDQVEEALKWCKAEQARLHGNIQVYQEMLRSLRLQALGASQDLEDAPKGSEGDLVPQEKEEIELVERALKEALRIRSSAPFKGPRCGRELPRPPKEPGDPAVTEPNPTSGTRRGKQVSDATSKSRPLSHKETRRPGLSSLPGARSRKCLQPHKGAVGGPHPASLFLVQREKHTRPGCNPVGRGQARPEASSLGGDEPLGRCGPSPSPQEVARVPHAGGVGGRGKPPQNRITSDLTSKWKSLRIKQNRLWDKVVVLQNQEVPERRAFVEKMGACFPRSWPCGSPDQTRALVDSLTRQGQDLSHCYQVEKLLAHHGSSWCTKPDGSLPCAPHGTLEDLDGVAASLGKHAAQVRQEWEAWDRWRPEGGCLCPDAPGGATGAPRLPPTATVTTETELVELEMLRLRVVLLQQEVHLQQVLSDSLSPQLPSLLGGPGPPDSSVLRDVYSLLAEGGERFPALVLDAEPD